MIYNVTWGVDELQQKLKKPGERCIFGNGVAAARLHKYSTVLQQVLFVTVRCPLQRLNPTLFMLGSVPSIGVQLWVVKNRDSGGINSHNSVQNEASM